MPLPEALKPNPPKEERPSIGSDALEKAHATIQRAITRVLERVTEGEKVKQIRAFRDRAEAFSRGVNLDTEEFKTVISDWLTQLEQQAVNIDSTTEGEIGALRSTIQAVKKRADSIEDRVAIVGLCEQLLQHRSIEQVATDSQRTLITDLAFAYGDGAVDATNQWIADFLADQDDASNTGVGIQNERHSIEQGLTTISTKDSLAGRQALAADVCVSVNNEISDQVQAEAEQAFKVLIGHMAALVPIESADLDALGKPELKKFEAAMEKLEAEVQKKSEIIPEVGNPEQKTQLEIELETFERWLKFVDKRSVGKPGDDNVFYKIHMQIADTGLTALSEGFDPLGGVEGNLPEAVTSRFTRAERKAYYDWRKEQGLKPKRLRTTIGRIAEHPAVFIPIFLGLSYVSIKTSAAGLPNMVSSVSGGKVEFNNETAQILAATGMSVWLVSNQWSRIRKAHAKTGRDWPMTINQYCRDNSALFVIFALAAGTFSGLTNFAGVLRGAGAGVEGFSEFSRVVGFMDNVFPQFVNGIAAFEQTFDGSVDAQGRQYVEDEKEGRGATAVPGFGPKTATQAWLWEGNENATARHGAAYTSRTDKRTVSLNDLLGTGLEDPAMMGKPEPERLAALATTMNLSLEERMQIPFEVYKNNPEIAKYDQEMQAAYDATVAFFSDPEGMNMTEEQSAAEAAKAMGQAFLGNLEIQAFSSVNKHVDKFKAAAGAKAKALQEAQKRSRAIFDATKQFSQGVDVAGGDDGTVSNITADIEIFELDLSEFDGLERVVDKGTIEMAMEFFKQYPVPFVILSVILLGYMSFFGLDGGPWLASLSHSAMKDKLMKGKVREVQRDVLAAIDALAEGIYRMINSNQVEAWLEVVMGVDAPDLEATQISLEQVKATVRRMIFAPSSRKTPVWDFIREPMIPGYTPERATAFNRVLHHTRAAYKDPRAFCFEVLETLFPGFNARTETRPESLSQAHWRGRAQHVLQIKAAYEASGGTDFNARVEELRTVERQYSGSCDDFDISATSDPEQAAMSLCGVWRVAKAMELGELTSADIQMLVHDPEELADRCGGELPEIMDLVRPEPESQFGLSSAEYYGELAQRFADFDTDQFLTQTPPREVAETAVALTQILRELSDEFGVTLRFSTQGVVEVGGYGEVDMMEGFWINVYDETGELLDSYWTDVEDLFDPHGRSSMRAELRQFVEGVRMDNPLPENYQPVGVIPPAKVAVRYDAMPEARAETQVTLVPPKPRELDDEPAEFQEVVNRFNDRLLGAFTLPEFPKNCKELEQLRKAFRDAQQGERDEALKALLEALQGEPGKALDPQLRDDLIAILQTEPETVTIQAPTTQPDTSALQTPAGAAQSGKTEELLAGILTELQSGSTSTAPEPVSLQGVEQQLGAIAELLKQILEGGLTLPNAPIAAETGDNGYGDVHRAIDVLSRVFGHLTFADAGLETAVTRFTTNRDQQSFLALVKILQTTTDRTNAELIARILDNVPLAQSLTV